MKSSNSFQLTTVILAGGGAERMGGVDKGLQMYDGRPMIDYVCGLARSVSDAILVSANRNAEIYKKYADFVVSDSPDVLGKGPLAGMATVVGLVETSHILLLPCDTPNVPKEALARLICNAKKKSDVIHYITTDSGPHPLHALLPVSCLMQLRDYLAQISKYGVMGFYKQVGCLECYWENDKDFNNINYASQLR